MWTVTPVEVLDPDLKSRNWTSTAVPSAALVALRATRVVELIAVKAQLLYFKSGSRTSTGVKVHIKLYISNNRPRAYQWAMKIVCCSPKSLKTDINHEHSVREVVQ